MISEDTLIYDIETITYGVPDSSRDRLRIFGCYSYKTKKYYLLTDKDDVQKVVDAHQYLVGFNNAGTRNEPGYDNTILIREDIIFKNKTIIDLMVIFKQRAGQMKIKKGMLGDLLMRYSLDYITRTLGIVDDNTAKETIDYSIFAKNVWSVEEIKQIERYTKRDLEITKRLYEWVEEYFEGFIPFISEEDVKKKAYLTSSIARFAYKAICKEMNWNEEYDEGDKDDERIAGGYVAYPAGEKFEGNIYCVDYRSLYPHITIQCNLYGRKEDDDRPVWDGSRWELEGRYHSDELSGVCKLLQRWYKERLEYKKNNDKREYTIKIIINAIYGILNNKYYKKVYDKTAGGDCTRLGRQWIRYARSVFHKEGYDIIYSDTDSIFIKDNHDDKQKMLSVKDRIIEDIKKTVPFPQDTFDMGIDDEIKYIYFFKGRNTEDKDTDKEMDDLDFINKPKGLMKKNYIYVTKDDRVVVKNLGINKKSITPLSKKIFWEYLVPKIKKGEIKFSKAYINDLVIKLLDEDITLAAMRKQVMPYDKYTKSPSSLSAQISLKYGAGIYFLVPNTRRVGVGKGKSYCTIEEFKEHKMNASHVDTSVIWKELDYFIKPAVTKNIFDFEEEG